MIEILLAALVVLALLARRRYAALRAPRLVQRVRRERDYAGRLRRAGVMISMPRLSRALALLAMAGMVHRASDVTTSTEAALPAAPGKTGLLRLLTDGVRGRR